MKKIAATPSRKAYKSGKFKHRLQAEADFLDRINENDGCNHNCR